MAQRQQGHAAEYQCQICMRNKNAILMPDRSGPRLTKTARGTVVQQGAAGIYATVEQRRKRGGKHVRDKHKRRMGRKMGVKVGTLNVGNMTGKGREFTDMIVKRKWTYYACRRQCGRGARPGTSEMAATYSTMVNMVG